MGQHQMGQTAARQSRSHNPTKQHIFIVLCGFLAACGATVQFERSPAANRWQPLASGTDIVVARSLSELASPIEVVGTLRLPKRREPLARDEAIRQLQSGAGRYGCDAIAEAEEEKTEVKVPNHRKPGPADASSDDSDTMPEFEWTARCVHTARAPTESGPPPRAAAVVKGRTSPKSQGNSDDSDGARAREQSKQNAKNAAEKEERARQAAKIAAEKDEKSRADKDEKSRAEKDEKSRAEKDDKSRQQTEAAEKERKRVAAEQAEKERKDKEKLEKEKERTEKEKAEKEKAEKERAEKAEKERERAEKAEKDKELKRAAAESTDKAKAASAALDKAKAAAESTEKDRKRLALSAADKARAAADVADRDRAKQAAEAAEKAQVAAEVAEKARKDVEIAEKEYKKAVEIATEKAKAAGDAGEKLEKERRERERADKEKADKEAQQREKSEKDKAADARKAAEAAEKAKKEKDKTDKEKAAAARKQAEIDEKNRKDSERNVREQAEKGRHAAEIAAKKTAKDRAKAASASALEAAVAQNSTAALLDFLAQVQDPQEEYQAELALLKVAATSDWVSVESPAVSSVEEERGPQVDAEALKAELAAAGASSCKFLIPKDYSFKFTMHNPSKYPLLVAAVLPGNLRVARFLQPGQTSYGVQTTACIAHGSVTKKKIGNVLELHFECNADTSARVSALRPVKRELAVDSRASEQEPPFDVMIRVWQALPMTALTELYLGVIEDVLRRRNEDYSNIVGKLTPAKKANTDGTTTVNVSLRNSTGRDVTVIFDVGTGHDQRLLLFRSGIGELKVDVPAGVVPDLKIKGLLPKLRSAEWLTGNWQFQKGRLVIVPDARGQLVAFARAPGAIQPMAPIPMRNEANALVGFGKVEQGFVQALFGDKAPHNCEEGCDLKLRIVLGEQDQYVLGAGRAMPAEITVGENRGNFRFSAEQ